MNQNKLIDPKVQDELNSKLNCIVENCVDIGYEEFGKYMKNIAKEVALEDRDVTKGWFEHSKEFLKLTIKERNDLLYKVKINGRVDEFLKQKCRDAHSNMKNIVEVAKGKWVEYLMNNIKNININPKKAQEKIKLLAQGYKGDHTQKNAMKFCDSKRNIAVTDKENTNLAAEYFNKVFNRDTEVDQKHVYSKKHKPRVDKLAEPILQEEFNCAIDKLTWHKVLGINSISPNLLKALDDYNK